MFTRDAPRIILNILVACIRQADTRFCEKGSPIWYDIQIKRLDCLKLLFVC